MGLSTHILDTASGRPAAGVMLTLSLRVESDEDGDAWQIIGRGDTDSDGRSKTLLGENALERGVYALRFDTGNYFHSQGTNCLYPYVEIVFVVADDAQHYHIPLLLTANGYTTYRGS